MVALEVLWLPQELAPSLLADSRVVVIDVIRATTSITTALAAGGQRVIPTGSVAAARAKADRIGRSLLCGERNGLPPEGFDLGNSPREFTSELVAGESLIFTTTNGTAAIEAATDARELRLACFRNVGTVARVLSGPADIKGGPIIIICSGRNGRIGMDDAWCAGHLVERILKRSPSLGLGDGAQAACAFAASLGRPTRESLAKTDAGRSLCDLGLGEDLVPCAKVDDLSVVPIWYDGAFVKGGEEDADAG
jgi:2-phosphosulfolactate phosphatase